ncbi:MAG: class I SAM-dependent methyltransferase, partial [Acidimicrobiales bacterium]
MERFVAGDLHGGDRAGEVAAQIAGMVGAEVLDGALVLEIGCGTAALGVALAARADHVVVSDVALSWLVLARRRLVEAGISNASVVACTGDRLPFATATFDLVAAADVIEHVPDP